MNSSIWIENKHPLWNNPYERKIIIQKAVSPSHNFTKEHGVISRVQASVEGEAQTNHQLIKEIWMWEGDLRRKNMNFKGGMKWKHREKDKEEGWGYYRRSKSQVYRSTGQLYSR